MQLSKAYWEISMDISEIGSLWNPALQEEYFENKKPDTNH